MLLHLAHLTFSIFSIVLHNYSLTLTNFHHDWLSGLEQAGRMKSKETVLVTAAAGGTGQFAVQLAKLAGNTVVATCGSDDKAQLLTDLGCHRVINYNKEQTKVCSTERC